MDCCPGRTGVAAALKVLVSTVEPSQVRIATCPPGRLLEEVVHTPNTLQGPWIWQFAIRVNRGGAASCFHVNRPTKIFALETGGIFSAAEQGVIPLRVSTGDIGYMEW